MAPASRRFVFHPNHPNRAHLCALFLLSAITLLSGCGNFFVCEGKTSCPTTCVASSTVTCPPPTTGTGVNMAYVGNPASSSNNVNGYNLANGNLTTNASGAPFNFGYSPIAMVVTPANTFLYTASNPALSTGYLYGYTINTSTGALNGLSGNSPLITESAVSLAVSPDGQWLFVLDANGLTLSEYSINASTGALTFNTTGAITPGAGTVNNVSNQVAVAPSGDYVAVALGTGGIQTFTLTTATGALTPQNPLAPSSSQVGFFGVAIDATNNLYVAGTNGLTVFSSTTAGVLTNLKTYTTGNGPRSVAVNTAGTFVYVGNKTDGTISGFSIGTNAVLTAIAGSPFTGPTLIGALAFDTTGNYLITSGYNDATGIELFSIGTSGALTSSGAAASGTTASILSSIATTHPTS
ncbi:MAG TPA: beta-propeller fold lactonase family protein [Acidobacteriaceae bacterium]|nr:beta-propeller fold lactonase family protein [Acidobacteriaceae bacterium]